SIGDVAFDLEGLSGPSGPTSASLVPAPGQSKRRERFDWMAASVVLLLTALGFAIGYFRRAPADVATIRFPVSLPEKVTLVPDVGLHYLSISPDGRYLAFIATSEGQRSLWLRPIDALSAQALPGTEGAFSPFWSPDSRFIGFFAEGKLKKIEASGGLPQPLCEVPANTSSGAWGAGVILLDGSGTDFKGIYRVPDTGGVVTPLLKIDLTDFPWLYFLPGGQHFLYSSLGRQEINTRGIYVSSLNSSETRLLLQTRSRAEYAPPGYLLYVREGSLVAQPFDVTHFRLSGEPLTVVEQLPNYEATGWAEFSVSGNGMIAYQTYTTTSLVWFDRSGRTIGSVGAPGLYQHQRLSPDGQRIAIDVLDARTGKGGLWIRELARNTSTRFTFSSDDTGDPVWSPDGRRLAFFSFHGLN